MSFTQMGLLFGMCAGHGHIRCRLEGKLWGNTAAVLLPWPREVWLWRPWQQPGQWLDWNTKLSPKYASTVTWWKCSGRLRAGLKGSIQNQWRNQRKKYNCLFCTFQSMECESETHNTQVTDVPENHFLMCSTCKILRCHPVPWFTAALTHDSEKVNRES